MQNETNTYIIFVSLWQLSLRKLKQERHMRSDSGRADGMHPNISGQETMFSICFEKLNQENKLGLFDNCLFIRTNNDKERMLYLMTTAP